jgi:hypothetical protein
MSADIPEGWTIPKDPAFWSRPVFLNIDVFTLLVLHGHLCLALRHPENQGRPRDVALEVVKQFGAQLVEHGAITDAMRQDAEREIGA